MGTIGSGSLVAGADTADSMGGGVLYYSPSVSDCVSLNIDGIHQAAELGAGLLTSLPHGFSTTALSNQKIPALKLSEKELEDIPDTY